MPTIEQTCGPRYDMVELLTAWTTRVKLRECDSTPADPAWSTGPWRARTELVSAEVLGVHLVDELPELVHDLLLLLLLDLGLDLPGGGLVEHRLGGVDRGIDADRERDGVGWAARHPHGAVALAELELGVEGAITQLGHPDARQV